MKVNTGPKPVEALPAEVYAQVFENFPAGRQVLDDLVRRFGRSPYVAGGLEGDRATCYNAGSRKVLDFILSRINQAAGINEPGAED